jgi:hypothetical protein
MSQITWWLQLKESTALENHEEIRSRVAGWAASVATYAFSEDIIWEAGTVMPTKISIQGAGPPPDISEWLQQLQPHLEDREYMIFIMTVDRDTYDSVGVHCHVLTKRIVAEISGAELAERAKHLVMAAEEEILAGGQEPLDSFG